ncbi:sensor histidine kinase [Streptomyces sp. NRRL S-337]|uniref:sensor histidine kinase n=1 Tax=Streptomyces sp. NRRL S-337 TaxID=1463900 RepID=UPI0006905628|nr:sensor histidine kinase [Streptomyces sp. NRRL S-337]
MGQTFRLKPTTAARVPEGASTLGSVVGTTIGLIPLLSVIPSLSTTGNPLPTVLAAVCALLLFAGSQVTLAWSYHSARLDQRFRLALLIPLVVMSVVLPLWLGKEWTLLMPYLAATSALAVPARMTLPALAIMISLAIFVGGRVDAARSVSLVVMTAAVGLAMTTYRRILDLNTELRRTRRELARAAVTEERLRFSRDMHDMLGHSLLQLTLHTEVTRRLYRAGETDVEAELLRIENMGREALERVRTAVTGYRKLSLTTVIDESRLTLADAGVSVTVRNVADALPEDIETTLSWIAREALTNVVRHAKATSCRVEIRTESGRAVLEVTDDGTGPEHHEPGPGGNGLAGLAERVTALAGRLDTGPAPGGGFRLQAVLPLTEDVG